MARVKSKPTIDDIAAHSGVSGATVSRILNRSGSVSKKLVEKVKNSLKELGIDRAKTGFIALAFGGPHDSAIDGVYLEAEKLGYSVIPLHVGNTEEITGRNLQLLKMIDFDAIIILKDRMNPQELREQFQLGGMPIVMLSQSVDVHNVHCIDTDRCSGMYKAVKYLFSLGHKRIAYISAPLEYETAKARKRGIDKALNEAGLENINFTLRQGASSIENGFQMTGTLLNSPVCEKPSAIVAYDDRVAIGCLHALNSHGIRIPEDISVVGFDDIYVAPYTNPALTTVHQPKEKMGQLAVTKIDNILSGKDLDKGGITLMECPLIVRESTGPAAKSV